MTGSNATFLKLLAATLVIGGAAWALSQVPAPREALAARSGPPLGEAASWGYQLQNARPERIDPAIDLLVIDYSIDGSAERTYSADAVEAFRQRRRTGRPRIVLAYLSIGEAENYRDYWRSYWRLLPPSWLGEENKDWRGNFLVRYWQPGWQRIIVEPRRSLISALLERFFASRKPYLDRILEAGFDGVYLDRVDAFQSFGKERPTAEADMAEFVAAISSYAKSRRPGFLVVPQNGEELLRRAPYRRVIDGIAKEDLLFGADSDGSENAPREIARSISLLNRARADGLPVLTVEYLSDAELRTKAHARHAELGYVLHFARRELKLPPDAPIPRLPSADNATQPKDAVPHTTPSRKPAPQK